MKLKKNNNLNYLLVYYFYVPTYIVTKITGKVTPAYYMGGEIPELLSVASIVTKVKPVS